MFATMQKVANMTLFSVLKFNHKPKHMCFGVHGKVMRATPCRLLPFVHALAQYQDCLELVKL